MEARMNGTRLFYDRMPFFFPDWVLEASFKMLEKPRDQGSEEAGRILRIVEKVDLEDEKAVKEAFSNSEDPLGWFVAGAICDEKLERVEFWKKSAEGGCSWGQVRYATTMRGSMHASWLEKAASQNNPMGLKLLGDWYQREEQSDTKRALSCYRAAAEMGWKPAMEILIFLLREEGGAKNFREAVVWAGLGAYKQLYDLTDVVMDGELEREGLGDYQEMCYLIGWGFYWYQYQRKDPLGGGFSSFRVFNNKVKFIFNCMDYYCMCFELQQKSIFLFLRFWNQTVGIKGPGVVIAKMVWKAREENLLERFEATEGEVKRRKTEADRRAGIRSSHF
jgi:hypothetical protein